MEHSCVLIIGGGKDTLFLIEQVKSLGFNTLVVDRNKNAPAATIADEHLCLSAWDSRPIIDAVQGKRIDACLTRSSGQAVFCWAEICQALGFSAPKSSSVKQLTGKLSLHRLGTRLEINTPTTQTFDEWKSSPRISFPLIVKPDWETVGKKGVVLVKDAERIETAVDFAAKYTAEGPVLVQEYLNGKDFTLLGGCIDNRYYPYAILKEENRFFGSAIVNSGFSKVYNKSIAKKVIKIAESLCYEMDLGFAPFNLNFRISNHDAPYLLECSLDFGGEGVLEKLIKDNVDNNFIKYYLESFIFRSDSYKMKKLNAKLALIGKDIA